MFCTIRYPNGNVNKGILSGGDFIRGDYVRRGFCPGFARD